MQSLYLSPSVIACFDGEQTPPAGGGGAPPQDPAKLFSQEDLNRILADDRRKHQGALHRAEQTLEDMAASKNLTLQEREQLAQQLEDMRKETQTKEQRLAAERKELESKLTKQLTDEKKDRDTWKNRYCEETTARALTDAAAGNDAFRPDQIVTVLKPYSRLTEITDEKGKGTGHFKVLVDFPDQDENGQPTVVAHTPESAVRRMKELPQTYGNLFKSGVVSGIGASAGVPAGGGKLDLRKLTQQQYMEIRAKNPELLGLRAQKKGR